MPLFIEYLKRRLESTLDFVTGGKLIDIVLKGFDVGIHLKDSTTQDVIIAPFGLRLRFIVVGYPPISPSTAAHACPQAPNRTQCVRSCFLSSRIYKSEFQTHSETFEVEEHAYLTLDKPRSMIAAAGARLGRVSVTEWHAAEGLKNGS